MSDLALKLIAENERSRAPFLDLGLRQYQRAC
jgi:hypothetical protein